MSHNLHCGSFRLTEPGFQVAIQRLAGSFVERRVFRHAVAQELELVGLDVTPGDDQCFRLRRHVRRVVQLETTVLERLVALGTVAPTASRSAVHPRVWATLGHRDDVLSRQLHAAEFLVAVAAGVVVPEEQGTVRERHAVIKDFVGNCDDVRHRDLARHTSQARRAALVDNFVTQVPRHKTLHDVSDRVFPTAPPARPATCVQR